MQLQFLGANRQVTGSRYLVQTEAARVLLDCGMFQERAFLERNWETPPFDPRQLHALVLTHGHLDHCGLIPRLVAQGFSGPIYCTPPTVELATIIMADSARIQMEDVLYKRKRHAKERRKGPHPVEPLYTVEDAQRASGLLRPVPYAQEVPVAPGITARFHEAGHILGSASVELTLTAAGRTHRVLFSGDVGQWNKPLIRDPQLPQRADTLILESTYGDRNHPDAADPQTQLAQVIGRTAARGGKTIIPTFAVERAQELMYHISRLIHDQRIPQMPVFLDSPMAVDVTEVFRRHRECLDEETLTLLENHQAPLRFPGLTFTRTVEQSMALNDLERPAVIMASSGMCTGGRIKHHLKRHIEDPRNTIVFVGYQAVGTLGRIILDGVQDVRILGQRRQVRAEIAQLHGFSAHADHDDLLRWVGSFTEPPTRVLLTHGEPQPAQALAEAITAQHGWQTQVPEYGQTVELLA